MNHKQEMQRFDSIVGSNLRALRCLFGYSQHYIGEQLGLTSQQVQKYEKATNRISAGRLWVLSQVFEIPVEAFFAGCGDVHEDVELLQLTLNEILLLKALRQLPDHLQKSFVDMIQVTANGQE